MGGRGKRSGMASEALSASRQSSVPNFDVSGRININPMDLPIGIGIHQYVEGTAYFGRRTSKSELIQYVDNQPYTTNSRGDKVLAIDVVGKFDSGYPSKNIVAAHATITKLSDNTFELSYPSPSGTGFDKVYKTESAAMKAGRNALRKFVNKQYTG